MVKHRLRNGHLAGDPNSSPRCGAKTRKGQPCQGAGVKKYWMDGSITYGRCRMHGGKGSGAPCGAAHGRYVHGLYSKEHQAFAGVIRRLLNMAPLPNPSRIVG